MECVDGVCQVSVVGVCEWCVYEGGVVGRGQGRCRMGVGG
mgnify:CR=1 FL=1